MSDPRRFLTGVFVLLLALPASAQAPKDGDLLEEAKRREQVAAQKAEADFRAAVVELHRLAAKDPAKAAERFETILAVLESDTSLGEHKRAAWSRMVKDRVRVLKAEAEDRAKADREKADAVLKSEERRGGDAIRSQDNEKVRSGLEGVRRLQNEGKPEDAARAAADLARRNPESPAAAAANRISAGNHSLSEARTMRDDKARRTELALREVDRSASPPKGDIEFPSPEKWREITKRRSKSNLTETEKAIMQALDAPTSVNFKGSSFDAAIDYLQTLTGQTILVDKSTLESAGIGYDTPVNTTARNVTLRTVLRKLLGQFNLTYVVKDQAIQIVTPEKAKETMSVRTYYLGDLAFATQYQFGAGFSAPQMNATVNQLIQLITGTVDPDSWSLNNSGGRGTIFFDPRTLTLIIKQNAEIHHMLGGFGK